MNFQLFMVEQPRFIRIKIGGQKPPPKKVKRALLPWPTRWIVLDRHRGKTEIAKASRKNNMNILAGSFGRWRRCSLVTDRLGYAPRSRLASGQNSCAIIVHVIFS
jgi:hypothetical protein